MLRSLDSFLWFGRSKAAANASDRQKMEAGSVMKNLLNVFILGSIVEATTLSFLATFQKLAINASLELSGYVVPSLTAMEG